MGKTIIKSTCLKCKGEGVILKGRAFFGVMSFGIFTAFDKLARHSKRDSMFAERCPKCKGTGFCVTQVIESP